MVRTVFAARHPRLQGWLDDHVGFVSTMVDRIAPPTDVVESERLATQTGVFDAVPVIGEPFRQWVLEDRFRGPRPPLETVGVEVSPTLSPTRSSSFAWSMGHNRC